MSAGMFLIYTLNSSRRGGLSVKLGFLGLEELKDKQITYNILHL